MNENKPDKQQVRIWLKREIAAHRPPPGPEEIRRCLGIGLIDAARMSLAKKIAM